MGKSILSKKFFLDKANTVAPKLLGKTLVRKVGSRTLYLIIIETEAYLGSHDLASHARFGKTKRNYVMFKDGGHWYVYFVYGMHWLLNIVTGKIGSPSAVLIRGGILLSKNSRWIDGPGKITKVLKINGSLTGRPSLKKSGLWIEDWGIRIERIKKSPRIGVGYSGKWAKKLLRFTVKDVSGRLKRLTQRT